MKLYLHCYS